MRPQQKNRSTACTVLPGAAAVGLNLAHAMRHSCTQADATVDVMTNTEDLSLGAVNGALRIRQVAIELHARLARGARDRGVIAAFITAEIRIREAEAFGSAAAAFTMTSMSILCACAALIPIYASHDRESAKDVDASLVAGSRVNIAKLTTCTAYGTPRVAMLNFERTHHGRSAFATARSHTAAATAPGSSCPRATAGST